jgi:hypothetical protein
MMIPNLLFNTSVLAKANFCEKNIMRLILSSDDYVPQHGNAQLPLI